MKIIKFTVALLVILACLPMVAYAAQYNNERIGPYVVNGTGTVDIETGISGVECLKITSAQNLTVEMAPDVSSINGIIDIETKDAAQSKIHLKNISMNGFILAQSAVDAWDAYMDITLENVKVNSKLDETSGDPLMLRYSTVDLRIQGNNELVCGNVNGYGVDSSGRTEISGSGYLKAQGPTYGICVGTLVMEAGAEKVEAVGEYDGVYCGGSFYIRGGELICRGKEYGIRTPENIIVESGKITAEGGIVGLYSEGGRIEISGGTVNTTGNKYGALSHLNTIVSGGANVFDGKSEYGIQGDNVIINSGENIIKGGICAIKCYSIPEVTDAMASVSYDGSNPERFAVEKNGRYKWVRTGSDILLEEDGVLDETQEFDQLPPLDEPVLVLPDNTPISATPFLNMKNRMQIRKTRLSIMCFW